MTININYSVNCKGDRAIYRILVKYSHISRNIRFSNFFSLQVPEKGYLIPRPNKFTTGVGSGDRRSLYNTSPVT